MAEGKMSALLADIDLVDRILAGRRKHQGAGSVSTGASPPNPVRWSPRCFD
jgi:hypothetical protein